jgi:DNA-binding response OmpR family regulator
MPAILLIEDALDLATVVRRELEAEGHRVRHTADGMAGWQAFQHQLPDLVILDWMLPGLDGLEILRRIRKTSALPVLMLTARGEETDRVVGLELGADDYLTKPFGMRELMARVHALLRRIEHVQTMLAADRGGAEETVSYAGGRLRVDPCAFEATLDGQPLNLTRTELDLLHLLLRNPGRAFSRTYLLDTVWGEGFIAGDRSVDNAVLRLRRKLGPLEDAIETVWGVGYRLKLEGKERA